MLEVESLSAISDGPLEEAVWGGRYFLKDITGDNIPEIFVMMDRNAKASRWYKVMQFRNGTLEYITVEGTESGTIDIDSVEYKDGLVYTTWHGNFERGMEQYTLQGNMLVRVKGVGLYITGYNDTSCHVRQVNIRQDQSVSFTEIDFIENCNLWTEDLYRYFDMQHTGVERAAFKPKEDTRENRDKAEALGFTPREYALLVLENNPAVYPSTVIDSKTIQLLKYQHNWLDFRMGYVEALTGG